MELKEAVIKRNYSDSVFRRLFNNPENLLSLYNALSGTAYKNAGNVQITTLENALYMNIKNDVSCLICSELSLYEHQSTVCGNMPLRDLLYVTDQLKVLLKDNVILRRKKQLIPTPRFVVFYTGEESQPERRMFRLSDSFAGPTDHPQLELVVEQFDLNGDHNRDLKKKCPILGEYAAFIQTVRRYRTVHKDISKAVAEAVDECIERNILKEFLLEQKAEVIAMSIYEFDEEEYYRYLREDLKEELAEEMRKEFLEKEQIFIQQERQKAEQQAETERQRLEQQAETERQRLEQQAETERQRLEQQVETERQRADRIEAELAKYKERFGEIA